MRRSSCWLLSSDYHRLLLRLLLHNLLLNYPLLGRMNDLLLRLGMLLQVDEPHSLLWLRRRSLPNDIRWNSDNLLLVRLLRNSDDLLLIRLWLDLLLKLLELLLL